MSLIIGIRCKDGIVIGSDSSATFGSMGRSTIRQQARKVTLIDDTLICATAGTVGLSQQFSGCLKSLWDKSGFRDLQRHDMMSNLGTQFFEYSKPLIEAASAAKSLYGKAAWESLNAQTIVALPHTDGPTLFWFDEACAPEEVTENLPFISIGSGSMIADPFLALIKRVIWANEMPSLSVGIFSVAWTLKHAIETNAGGVAGQPRIYTLTGQSAIEIDGTLINTYMKHVEIAEEKVASIIGMLDDLATQSDSGIDSIPKPLGFKANEAAVNRDLANNDEIETTT